MTAQKRRKKKATAVETKIASALGGRRTYNSGTGLEKGDAQVSAKYAKTADGIESTDIYTFRIESKHTATSRYTLSSIEWGKVVLAGLGAGQHPVFHVKIDCPSFDSQSEFVIIRSDLFAELAGHAPPVAESTNVKSITISSAKWRIEISPYASMHGHTPCIRFVMDKPSPAKGDVCLMQYTDFIRLVDAAKARVS